MENLGYFSSLWIFLLFIVLGFLINLAFERVFRVLVRKTKTDVDDRILTILKRPVFWSIVLLGIFTAVFSLELSSAFLYMFKKTLISLGVLIWGIVLLEIFKIFFAEIEHKTRKEHKSMLPDLLPFLYNLTRVVVVIILFLVLLSYWGIDITPALASAGVVGIAVAFAARDTVANLFGGISVFFDKPYKTGDYVIVEGKHRGKVVEIGTRSTKIKTRDNILLTVPNSVMVTNTVVNETGFDPKLRIRIPLNISYNSDLEKAEKILIEICTSYPTILETPQPQVRFRKFGESGIKLEVLAVIVSPSDRGRIIHQIIKKIHKKFKQEKITIPFPQRDVYLKKA